MKKHLVKVKERCFIFILIIIFSIFSWVLASLGTFHILLQWDCRNTPTIGKTEKKITQKTEIKELENTLTNIVSELSPSIVSIIIEKDLIVYKSDPYGFFQQQVGSITQKVGGGTGFFISKDGKIITNKHVVSDKEATYIVITTDNKEYEAQVLAFDPLTDLAVLQIMSDETFTPLDFISAENEINIGQFVLAIGNALAEFQNSVSFWVVSGIGRNIQANENNLAGLIQTDTAINPGNSGWPLIDMDGKVLGINTAILDGAEGIGFAIQVSQKKIDYMLKSIAEHKVIKRPIIGVKVFPVTEVLARDRNLPDSYGAYVLEWTGSIIPGSSAEKAWIKPQDTILTVNGEKITLENTLQSQIQNKIPWEKITLTLRSKGEEIREIKIELGEY